MNRSLILLSEIDLSKAEEVNIDEIDPDVGINLSINLLGYEAKEELVKSSAGFKLGKSVLVSILLISAVLLVNAFGYLYLTQQVSSQQSLKEELESRKNTLTNKVKEYDKKIAQLNTLKDKKRILEWVVTKSYKWSTLLEEVRNRIPGNLWVGSLSINSSFNLNISGETFDYKTVSLFLANLKDSPAFNNVTLVSTSKKPGLTFSQMEAKLRRIELGEEPSVNLEEERRIKSKTNFVIRCKVVVPIK